MFIHLEKRSLSIIHTSILTTEMRKISKWLLIYLNFVGVLPELCTEGRSNFVKIKLVEYLLSPSETHFFVSSRYAQTPDGRDNLSCSCYDSHSSI